MLLMVLSKYTNNMSLHRDLRRDSNEVWQITLNNLYLTFTSSRLHRNDNFNAELQFCDENYSTDSLKQY